MSPELILGVGVIAVLALSIANLAILIGVKRKAKSDKKWNL